MSAIPATHTAVAPTQSIQIEPIQLVLRIVPLKDRIFEILKKFNNESWNDETSQRLRKWCVKVLRLGLHVKDEKSYMEVVAKKLKTLYTILNNPFDLGKPVQEPVRDRNQLWDKAYLEAWKKHSNHSPFDKEPIKDETHLFAQEILEVVKRLPKADTHLLVATPQITPTQIFSPNNAWATHTLVQTELRCAEARRDRNKARRENEKTEKAIKKHEKSNAILLDKIKQCAVAQTESNAKALDAQKEIHTKTYQEQNRHIADVKIIAQQTQSELNITKSEVALCQYQIDNLKHAYSQKAWECDSLRTQVNDMDSGSCVIS